MICLRCPFCLVLPFSSSLRLVLFLPSFFGRYWKELLAPFLSLERWCLLSSFRVVLLSHLILWAGAALSLPACGFVASPPLFLWVVLPFSSSFGLVLLSPCLLRRWAQLEGAAVLCLGCGYVRSVLHQIEQDQEEEGGGHGRRHREFIAPGWPESEELNCMR